MQIHSNHKGSWLRQASEVFTLREIKQEKSIRTWPSPWLCLKHNNALIYTPLSKTTNKLDSIELKHLTFWEYGSGLRAELPNEPKARVRDTVVNMSYTLMIIQQWHTQTLQLLVTAIIKDRMSTGANVKVNRLQSWKWQLLCESLLTFVNFTTHLT